MKIIKLPFRVKGGIVACGADLKGAFAAAAGDTVCLEDGFGDLSDPDNLASYEKAVKGCVKKLKITAQLVVCDMHPGYFSTRFAEDYARHTVHSTLCKIQHHEAHVAAVLADRSIRGRAIGVAFDGTGYGTDGNIWGGEFFIGDARAFKRAGHLRYVPMPGGSSAISQPWRMAFSYLLQAFGKKARRMDVAPLDSIDRRELRIVNDAIAKGINCPMTSSAGRLFDAAASLILGRLRSDKEAELPMDLEKIAIELCQDSYEFTVINKAGIIEINCSALIKGIVKDIKRGMSCAIISSKFHNSVAEIINRTARLLSKIYRTKNVALTGGVFQNKFLLSRAAGLLGRSGLNVITHSKFQTNDSGIPVGQVAIANARSRCGVRK